MKQKIIFLSVPNLFEMREKNHFSVTMYGATKAVLSFKQILNSKSYLGLTGLWNSSPCFVAFDNLLEANDALNCARGYAKLQWI